MVLLGRMQGCLAKVFSYDVPCCPVLCFWNQQRLCNGSVMYCKSLQCLISCCTIAAHPTSSSLQRSSHCILARHTAGVPAASAFTAEAVLQARRGFQSQLSHILSAGSSFDATSGAVVSAAALFEELLPGLAAANDPVGAVVGTGGGVGAAVALYQHVVDAVPTEVRYLHI